MDLIPKPLEEENEKKINGENIIALFFDKEIKINAATNGMN